jgi:hypothetical protein
MKSIPFGQRFAHPSKMSPATRRMLEISEGSWFWCQQHQLSHEGCHCSVGETEDDCHDFGPFLTQLECDEYGSQNDQV